MTRDKIFAVIVAWTKSGPPSCPFTEADRRAWINAREGARTILERENDAEWLRIIDDARLGEAVRKLSFEVMRGDAIWWLRHRASALEQHEPGVALYLRGVADALAAEVTNPSTLPATSEDTKQEAKP